MPDSSRFQWRRTNAPVASSRTDDIYFLNPNMGWAVNSNGQIIRTADGGVSWTEQARFPDVYLRCIGFAGSNKGWAGSLTRQQRLFATEDGGAHWKPVQGLPAAPNAVCGLSVVNESVVYASGTNYPNRPPGVIKTIDGGRTWAPIDMTPHANLLVDIYFTDPLHGWVVGGKAAGGNPVRNNVKAVVLRTEDGGRSWINQVAGIADTLPLGEWGWKIFFLTASIGFVSLENFRAGAILKTVDGGRTWTRHAVNDPQRNANLEGIGFVDENHGWVGGWGTADFGGGFSSETTDAGLNWRDANQIGRFLNRFRFFHVPQLVGYASGDTVDKYSDSPVVTGTIGLSALPARDEGVRVSTFPVEFHYTVAPGSRRLQIDVWDRFGEHVARVAEQQDPAAGAGSARWDGSAAYGGRAGPGLYIYRVSTDLGAESRIIRVT